MKTLILDFDGTVADTRSSIVQTIQYTAKKLGLSNANENEIKNLIGLPLKETFIKALHISDENILEKATDFYRSKYNEISLDTVELYPNVKDVLTLLYERKKTITIASSKGKDSLSALLKKLGIIQYLSLILGEQDVVNKKPAPDIVLRILEETKSTSDEALVVGDTAYDIEMGQRAKCSTCGVTYGNHTEKQLKEQKADYVINDFIDILNIVGYS